MAVLLLGIGGLGGAAVARSDPPAAGVLPPEARMMVWPKMKRHGDDMEVLIWSVLLLQKTGTAEVAERIASEPRMAPDVGDADVVNRRIPPRFFAFQEQLHVQALALRDAARGGDDTNIGDAFAELSRTCVQCHAAYLNPGARQ